jgi:hypothetical protein
LALVAQVVLALQILVKRLPEPMAVLLFLDQSHLLAVAVAVAIIQIQTLQVVLEDLLADLQIVLAVHLAHQGKDMQAALEATQIQHTTAVEAVGLDKLARLAELHLLALVETEFHLLLLDHP